MTTNRPRLLRNYFDQEIASYQVLKESRENTAYLSDKLSKWISRTRQSWKSLDKKGVTIPVDFLKPYPFPKEEFLPNNFDAIVNTSQRIFEMVQPKYQLRAHNVLREFDRCLTLFPEVLDSAKPYDILELSSGGCGGAEVAKHFGNTYQATDFLDGRGSVYAPIHNALNLPVIGFDGSKTPYAFDDNSYDIVACFQAIDAYGYEEHYETFIDEMLRIARKKVVLVFNPGLRAKHDKIENGYELLIRDPLIKRYNGLNFQKCPSTGMPAVTICPDDQV
ncbi:hypothetical protein CLV80_10257 [Yoonia maritima]|uniref:Methyltransferase family protein n=1 Tax=Yoonia maritima TaxID=1435347 RepID=A0A2T0W2G9_9RHOB|nr:hypothetical protein [Yoonia maritima]PRY79414.1 hypothetical protein CLV80_10257 [Yoonia maritima]